MPYATKIDKNIRNAKQQGVMTSEGVKYDKQRD